MKNSFVVVRFAGGLLAAGVLLAGCALPLSLSKGQGDAGQSGIPALAHANHDGSWMLPDEVRKNLLYVSDQSTGDLDVFDYPRGIMVGRITGLPEPQGLCADKRGDVFVTTFADQEILEYAHGGTSPIATLTNSGEYMEGCSVDPKTGNLAVINFETTSHGPGGVSIYAKAKGNPTVYSDSALLLGYQLGYDNASNIFLDGLDSNRNFEFAELPNGSSSFTQISLNVSIGTPGGVQWDGKYVAVGDAKGGEIYQTNGAGGQIEGTTTLTGADGVFQFCIDGKTVAGANVYGTTTEVWTYPGGSTDKQISGFTGPFGVAISKGKKK